MDALLVKSSASATKKATIITRGGMGNICVKHVNLIEHGTMKYAQYNNAVFVKYIEKGARKAKGFVLTFQPYLVILEGWQDIANQEIFKPAVNKGLVSVSEAKFSSCDDGWQKEFEAENGEFNNVIADYRGTKTL